VKQIVVGLAAAAGWHPAAQWPKRPSALRSAVRKTDWRAGGNGWTSGLTSWEAERLLEEVQGRFIHDEKTDRQQETTKNVQAQDDRWTAVAAAVILKEYLDRPEQTAE